MYTDGSRKKKSCSSRRVRRECLYCTNEAVNGGLECETHSMSPARHRPGVVRTPVAVAATTVNVAADIGRDGIMYGEELVADAVRATMNAVSDTVDRTGTRRHNSSATYTAPRGPEKTRYGMASDITAAAAGSAAAMTAAQRTPLAGTCHSQSRHGKTAAMYDADICALKKKIKRNYPEWASDDSDSDSKGRASRASADSYQQSTPASSEGAGTLQAGTRYSHSHREEYRRMNDDQIRAFKKKIAREYPEWASDNSDSDYDDDEEHYPSADCYEPAAPAPVAGNGNPLAGTGFTYNCHSCQTLMRETPKCPSCKSAVPESTMKNFLQSGGAYHEEESSLLNHLSDALSDFVI